MSELPSSENGAQETLSTGQFLVLISGLLSSAIGQSLIFAILPPLGRSVDFSEVQTNAIISMSALIFTLCSPWWGRLSDRLGRKPVMIIGMVGYAVGTAVFTTVFLIGLKGLLTGMTLYLLALIARCSQSVIMSGTSPAATAYAADHSSPAKRTQTLARLGTATSVGMIVGPVVGGALASFGLLVPLFGAAMLSALAALATWRLLPKSRVLCTDRAVRQKLRFTDPRLRVYLASSFGAFIGFSGIQQTLGYRLQDTLGLTDTATAQYTGISLMVSAFMTFTMQLTIAQRFKGVPIRLVQSGLAVLLIGALIIAGSQGFYPLLAGMACLGASIGLIMPAVAAGSSLAVAREEQGGAAGLVTATPAAGFVIGPIVAGSLYTIDPMLAPSASAVVVSLVLLYAWRRPPAPPASL